MPIEIKELVIRAEVRGEAKDESGGRAPAESEVDVDALVEACVRRVLRILHDAKER